MGHKQDKVLDKLENFKESLDYELFTSESYNEAADNRGARWSDALKT